MSINSTPNNNPQQPAFFSSDNTRTFNCVSGVFSTGLTVVLLASGNYSEATPTAALAAWQMNQCIYPASRPLEERDVKVHPNNGNK